MNYRQLTVLLVGFSFFFVTASIMVFERSNRLLLVPLSLGTLILTNALYHLMGYRKP
jgi:hypothetical protein